MAFKFKLQTYKHSNPHSYSDTAIDILTGLLCSNRVEKSMGTLEVTEHELTLRK